MVIFTNTVIEAPIYARLKRQVWLMWQFEEYNLVGNLWSSSSCSSYPYFTYLAFSYLHVVVLLYPVGVNPLHKQNRLAITEKKNTAKKLTIRR